MTKATAFFLSRLRRYLATADLKKRRELRKLHEELTDGRKLDKSHLSRHLACRQTPNMDTAIVYLRYAQLNGIIRGCLDRKSLFVYVDAKATAKERESKRG